MEEEERRKREERVDLHRAAPQRQCGPPGKDVLSPSAPAPPPKACGNLTGHPQQVWSSGSPSLAAWEAGLGGGQVGFAKPSAWSLTITLSVCFAIHGSDSTLLLRYLILLPSRERAKQVFLLICTLDILVIKQHLRKPIVKSILIGTKISQVVELQLRGRVSGALGHKVLRSQQGERLGERASVSGRPGSP